MAEKAVREIQRKTRRRFSAEEKIRIVIEGLRGEESIASLCRREGIVANLYYRWKRLSVLCKELEARGRARSVEGVHEILEQINTGCRSVHEHLSAERPGARNG